MYILRARTTSLLLAMLICMSAYAQTPSNSRHPAHAPIVYVNREYGFRFYLPPSWAGYKILTEQWDASEAGGRITIARGPVIVIRHPLWTEDDPREDIPIMVVRRRQWPKLADQTWMLTAAPYGPGELDHNKRFVFALGPRWDYDFADGWEEAEKIVTRHALHAF